MTSDTFQPGGLASLPPLQPLQTLSAQRVAWRIQYGLLGAILGLATGCALAARVSSMDTGLTDFTAVVLWGVMTSLVFAGWGLLLAQWRFAHYRAEHHAQAGVRVQDGIWWRTETWVPIARLQHLDVRQGPLDRHWGMATLSLHTAGTHDHVLHIRGLPVDNAHALRAALLPQLHSHHV